MEFFAKIAAGSKRRCHVRWFQVSDARFQVSGSRCAGSMCQVPSVRFQVPGVRGQVPGSMCHAPGIRDHIARDHVSDLRDQVLVENVENLHIKDILRLNGNYKLLLLLSGNYDLTNTFFYFLQHVSEKQRKKQRYLQCPFRYFSRLLATNAVELICRLSIGDCFCIFNNFKPT